LAQGQRKGLVAGKEWLKRQKRAHGQKIGPGVVPFPMALLGEAELVFKDLVPVLAPFRHHAPHVAACRSDGPDFFRQLLPTFVQIKGQKDHAGGGQLFHGPTEKGGLLEVQAATRAHVARPDVPLQDVKGHRVYGAFRQDKPRVRSFGPAVPKPFDAARGEAGKVPVLDLEATKALPVIMGEEGVLPRIDPDAAREERQAQDFRAKAPACQVGQGEAGPGLLPGRHDGGPVPCDREQVPDKGGFRHGRPRRSGPRPEGFADLAKVFPGPLLDEVDHRPVIAAIAHGKIHPVAVFVSSDHDLVAVRVAHHCGIKRAFPPVEDIASRRREL